MLWLSLVVLKYSKYLTGQNKSQNEFVKEQIKKKEKVSKQSTRYARLHEAPATSTINPAKTECLTAAPVNGTTLDSTGRTGYEGGPEGAVRPAGLTQVADGGGM